LAHYLCDLVVLCHGFITLHHEGLEGVKEGQKLLGWLNHPILVFLFILCFGKLVCFKTFWGPFNKTSKESPSMSDSLKECKCTCTNNFSLEWRTFSFPLLFMRALRAFFTGEPTLVSILPLFWAMGERIFSWVKALFGLTPSFSFSSCFCKESLQPLPPWDLFDFDFLLGANVLQPWVFLWRPTPQKLHLFLSPF